MIWRPYNNCARSCLAFPPHSQLPKSSRLATFCPSSLPPTLCHSFFTQMISAAEDDRRGRVDWVHAIRTHYMSDDGVGWGSRAWDSTTAQVSVVSRRKMGKAAVPATADANGAPSSPTKKPPTPKSRRRVSPGSAGGAKHKGSATAYKGDYVEWVYGSVSSVLADCTAQLIDGRPAALDTVQKAEFCGIAEKCCGAGRSAYAVAVAYIPSDVAAQVSRLDRNTPQGEAAYHDQTNHLHFIEHARPTPATDAGGGGGCIVAAFVASSTNGTRVWWS